MKRCNFLYIGALWLSLVACATGAQPYDRSTPEAAFLSLLEATKQGDLQAVVESFDIEAFFKTDNRLRQLQLTPEQQQAYMLQKEGKIAVAMQTAIENTQQKGGIKEVVFDAPTKERDGIVELGVTVFFNNGEQSLGVAKVKMINHGGVYKLFMTE